MDSFRNMGVLIPDTLADRIREAAEPLKESIRIAAEMIEEFRKDPGVDGIHIIAINIEENIPALFTK
jgi:hypothetical protein